MIFQLGYPIGSCLSFPLSPRLFLPVIPVACIATISQHKPPSPRKLRLDTGTVLHIRSKSPKLTTALNHLHLLCRQSFLVHSLGRKNEVNIHPPFPRIIQHRPSSCIILRRCLLPFPAQASSTRYTSLRMSRVLRYHFPLPFHSALS